MRLPETTEVVSTALSGADGAVPLTTADGVAVTVVVLIEPTGAPGGALTRTRMARLAPGASTGTSAGAVIGVSPPSSTPSPLTSRKICDAHSPLLSAVESVIDADRLGHAAVVGERVRVDDRATREHLAGVVGRDHDVADRVHDHRVVLHVERARSPATAPGRTGSGPESAPRRRRAAPSRRP